MKFFKKHKVLAFAVISFFVLSGVNFYMIFELVKVIRRDLAENQPSESFFWGWFTTPKKTDSLATLH